MLDNVLKHKGDISLQTVQIMHNEYCNIFVNSISHIEEKKKKTKKLKKLIYKIGSKFFRIRLLI